MTKRINVFVLINGLGPAGGAEKLLAHSLPYLNRDRFDYMFGYLRPWKNGLVPQFQKSGVPIVCLNQRKSFDLRVVPRLAALIRERQVDVLHLHLPFSGIVGRIANKIASVKVLVYTEHNLASRYRWLTGITNRLTYGYNDAVIAVSSEVEQSVRSAYGLDGRFNIRTIPNGVDSDQLAATRRDVQGVRKEFGIPLDHRLVINVASFTPKKRHIDLLNAAKRILSQEPRVTFLLVGFGPLEDDVKSQARRLEIDSNVVFAGFRSDAPRLMAASDLFVLSSQFEGLPISLLEAMGVGMPVVATRVGGIPEVVTDGVEGFLTDPLDPSQLAHKMLVLLNNSEMRKRFSENASNRIQEHFTVQRMVERTEAMYDKLLLEKGNYGY